MSISLINKYPKFKEWGNYYNWDECALNNKQYGEFLSLYLRNQNTPLVLNLNGSWGTGKTHFLKQLYVDLHHKNDYPTVYINAWESDFSNDPLLVIISELLEQLNNIHPGYSGVTDKLHQNLGKFAKKGWNSSLDLLAVYLASKLEDYDSTGLLGLANHAKFDANIEPVLGKSLTDNYKKQLAAIKDTHSCLSAYVNSFPEGRNKVFVLIDELDRCRPTFAIEMLETIKHFFSMENYVFVVATDTEQLSHSIKAVYGSSFDGAEYLSRFFNRSALIPLPDKRMFAKLLVEKSSLSNMLCQIKTFGETDIDIDFIATIIYEVSVMYDLSLRRVEQVFDKLESIVLYEISTKDRVFDIRLLIQLIAEYDSLEFRDCYHARKKYEFVKYILPTNIKSKYETTSDCIVNIALKKHGHKLVSENENIPNKIYVKNLSVLYLFSWEFANHNYEDLPNKEISVIHGYKQLIKKRDAITNFSSDNQHSPNTVSAQYIMNVYIDILQKHRNDIKQGLWSRSDYFKAVELTSSLGFE